MRRQIFLAGCVFMLLFILGGCGQTKKNVEEEAKETEEKNVMQGQEDTQNANDSTEYITEGTEEYRGFLLDNVLHSETEGEIHYNVYIPDSYDGSRSFALFFTLPGYEGLYFQGVGVNLRAEQFGFTAHVETVALLVKKR